MSGSQAKLEKAAIDAKVAKVREVVRSVSNNDIVLALHNFDMDVNRTIHAFTEVESALGAWEKNGAASKKKKNKGKKIGSNDAVSSAASTTTDTPKVLSANAPVRATTSAQPAVPKPVVDTSVTINTFSKLTDAAKIAEVERLSREFDQKVTEVKNVLERAEKQKNVAIAAILNAVNYRDRQLSVELEKTRVEAEKQTAKQRTLLNQILQKLNKGETAAVELGKFSAGNVVVDQVLNGKFAFDEKPPLRSVEKFGAGYLAVGSLTSEEKPLTPQNNASSTKPIQQNGKAKVNNVEQKANGTLPPANNSPVGKVINGVSDIKHSTSQSSLVSSLGEDSGLGQISPVSTEKVRSQAGGIVMESDGLSEDALAEIQNQFAETLKAQGMDPSFLSGLGSQVVAPRRRNVRKEPAQSHKNGQRNGTNNVIASH